MTDINALNALGGTSGASGAGQGMMDMGSEDFLRLLTTQLKNQDPLNPTDSTEFMGQIAQLTSASGIQELNASFASLTEGLRGNQTMQAASLIGREVTVESNTGYLPEDGALSGTVNLPSGVDNLTVTVTDGAGQVVRQMEMGSHAGGAVDFSWDGVNAEGERMPSGSYTISANAGNDGEGQSFQVTTAAEVESVNLGAAGENPTLNLRGLGEVSLAAVRQVR
ncbi:flagellar hook assembly protein FlgD [Ectothiorhodospiraceae bacterium WFHF3C12]|nr:flagellar hook assembly protein FlgD [Ectothiorhodospiraceae bacterium WFHF3C12]